MSLSPRNPLGYPDVSAFFDEGEIKYSWLSTLLAGNDYRFDWLQHEAQAKHLELCETARDRANTPPTFTAVGQTTRQAV
mgnify:FL=1